MSQRVRVEPNASFVLPYLKAFNYPHSIWIEQPDRLSYCIGARIVDRHGTVGAVWGHWIHPKVMSVHVLVFPGGKADWRQIMPRLLIIADFLGADEIEVSFDGTPGEAALGRLVERFGFEKVSDPDNETHFYRRQTYGYEDCPADPDQAPRERRRVR